MRLYFALGRTQAALTQYQLFCNILWQDLGVTPEGETKALARKIPKEGPQTASAYLPPVIFISVPGSSTDRIPLLGRDVERQTLLQYLESSLMAKGAQSCWKARPGLVKRASWSLLPAMRPGAAWRCFGGIAMKAAE